MLQERELRNRLKGINPNILIFSEVWTMYPMDISQIEFKNKKRKYEVVNHDAYVQEHMQTDYVDVLDRVLDFKFRDIMINVVLQGRRFFNNPDLKLKLDAHFQNYPAGFALMLFLDNHDTDRFMHITNGDKTLLDEAVKYMQRLQYPSIIYYGTEKGMMNQQSIVGRNNADDEVRQPMDWN